MWYILLRHLFYNQHNGTTDMLYDMLEITQIISGRFFNQIPKVGLWNLYSEALSYIAYI